MGDDNVDKVHFCSSDIYIDSHHHDDSSRALDADDYTPRYAGHRHFHSRPDFHPDYHSYSHDDGEAKQYAGFEHQQSQLEYEDIFSADILKHLWPAQNPIQGQD